MMTANEQLELVRRAQRNLRGGPSIAMQALDALERDIEERSKEEWVRKKYPWLFAPVDLGDVVAETLSAANDFTDLLREIQRQLPKA